VRDRGRFRESGSAKTPARLGSKTGKEASTAAGVAGSAAGSVPGKSRPVACGIDRFAFTGLGLRATDVVVGSNADPISRVRGCPPFGIADRATMSSIAQPQIAKSDFEWTDGARARELIRAFVPCPAGQRQIGTR